MTVFTIASSNTLSATLLAWMTDRFVSISSVPRSFCGICMEHAVLSLSAAETVASKNSRSSRLLAPKLGLWSSSTSILTQSAAASPISTGPTFLASSATASSPDAAAAPQGLVWPPPSHTGWQPSKAALERGASSLVRLPCVSALTLAVKLPVLGGLAFPVMFCGFSPETFSPVSVLSLLAVSTPTDSPSFFAAEASVFSFEASAAAQRFPVPKAASGSSVFAEEGPPVRGSLSLRRTSTKLEIR
mmetsp:Transcript_42870/g.101775  ORF Transcript_42870/g.101775 Transcript_42870/m.101775 type:complete len:245 (+) Transcript_42870:145-879(+)